MNLHDFHHDVDIILQVETTYEFTGMKDTHVKAEETTTQRVRWPDSKIAH